ncbi:MAG: YitT family protein [Maribacter sp.]|uniref:YitT family protein n=1 Tax=Maribacter sp. TaxID=1897614 RepID=UPI003C73FE5A
MTGKQDTKRIIKDIFFLSAGVIMASIGLKGFLLPNGFLDGGAMGIALLAQILTGIDLSVLIVLVNLPFILLGIHQVSLQFAIKSALAILALAVLVHFIVLPTITADKLLIAVFGGFFLGAGIGLSIRGGGVIDGTEVLAITVSRKSSLSVGDFISVFNVILFAFAALLINIETAMYSMLTYITASKTVDFILNGIEEYIGVMIISDKYIEIKHKISYDLQRGITVFRSDEGFGKRGTDAMDKKILFCAITRLEVPKLLFEIGKIDDKAFIVQYPLKDAKGGMIKKRPLH